MSLEHFFVACFKDGCEVKRCSKSRADVPVGRNCTTVAHSPFLVDA